MHCAVDRKSLPVARDAKVSLPSLAIVCMLLAAQLACYCTKDVLQIDTSMPLEIKSIACSLEKSICIVSEIRSKGDRKSASFCQQHD